MRKTLFNIFSHCKSDEISHNNILGSIDLIEHQ